MEVIRNRCCINCTIKLTHLRSRSLRGAAVPNIIILRSWVSPTPMSHEDYLYLECFVMIQDIPLFESLSSRIFGDRNVCVGCGLSIHRARTHQVAPNNPEWNTILEWTLPHMVPQLQKVCKACWMAATRTVQRQMHHDSNREIHTLPLDTEEMNTSTSDNIPLPPPLPQQPLFTLPTEREQLKIISSTHRRAASTTRRCLFPNCRNVERLLVPAEIKNMLLSRYRFYIPPCTRICSYHLNNNCWEDLNLELRDFTSVQVDCMLNMMERMKLKTLDFSNIDMMSPHLCHYWLGLTPIQFNDLLTQLTLLHEEVPSPSIALSMYLAKLRTGDSNERLSSFFEVPRTTFERYMTKARNSMTEQLVPLYLGLNHMSIQDVASRNTIIPEGFYGNSNLPAEVKPAIVICDATYVYIQSSSNYLFQKNTYSLHKYQNLVKPFMLVCCDGYILDCLGPFKANINDATIMKNEISRADGIMRNYFRQGDIFILDRGFRDVVADLKEYGYHPYMPDSLLESEHQLTTLQANKSRCVTMCRWVVEIVNGRLKQDYKLFRQEFFNRAAKHLMSDFRNGCALINKFRGAIQDKPEATEYLTIACSKIYTDNILANVVRAENLNRRRATFQMIDSDSPHLSQFPRLTLDDLKRFALGTYQLKQARSYYGEHVRQNGTYVIEINSEIEDDLPLVLGANHYLLRGRIKSRHISSRTYYIYLLISYNIHGLEAIKGYCCSCLVGNRTVGCCAHVMSVTWYLGWGRYNNVNAPASFLDELFDEYSYENVNIT